MEIRYRVTGKDRKALVMAIAEITGSDAIYPISPYMDVSRSVYMAELRGCPEMNLGGPEKTARNKKEAVDRMASLKALTKNVAYAWREEDRMGSIECGKLANFVVLDKDFLEDDINTIPDGKVVATIVDGNVVYTA